ncbi:autotransporter-associated beta strand repeat-containing protein, partial [Mesorhizobium sp. M5C.F.Ca.ET.164.01.1.1]|uniref:autotransporter-associated beta strand repeat-containing protein n=1 Tax=Mesorhizobium sp. M5C.F.Ca.ET.164.01.1.1 TaxID=2563957 RepID=UPI001093B17D
DGMIGDTGQYRNFDVLEKTGAGTWALTADNTATQAWTISQGTLQIGNGGTTGSILGNVTNNATLAFDRSDTYTYAGVISGSGAVSQIGTGTTITTGANTYSG